jgi:hypothetical protein
MWSEHIHLLRDGDASPGPARVFGDYMEPTVQVTGSGIQLQASNYRGTQDEIPEASWVNWDGALAAGIHVVTPGPRWIRATTAGSAEVTLTGKAFA